MTYKKGKNDNNEEEKLTKVLPDLFWHFQKNLIVWLGIIKQKIILHFWFRHFEKRYCTWIDFYLKNYF